MKVADLQKMLSKCDPEAEIGCAAAPNVTGWVNKISHRMSKVANDQRFLLVLRLEEETIGEEELDLVDA